VAGWGNLGGGVTQIVMGSVLFPLFELIFGNKETAWRTVCIIPGIVTLVTSYAIFKHSDDSPKGNFRKRSSKGLRANVSGKASLKTAAANINTWILALQYASCFGVEITMINAVALYFKEEFAQSTVSAAALASIFGWMNLFARGFGGFVSDMSNAKRGMRGRLIWQTLALSLQGIMLIIFSKSLTLGGAVINMIVLSIFVQSTEGSTYGIVPYVNPCVTGSIAGIVGAGGNIGGVCFGLLFTHFDYRQSFIIMGYVNVCSILFIAFINIKGHSTLFCGKEISEVLTQRLQHNEQQRNVANVSAKYENASIVRSNSDQKPDSFGSASLLDDVVGGRVDTNSSVNNVELSPTNTAPPPSDLSKEATNLQCTEL
jgi:NNP family nitrate/nitrite transporter-like MFS transporter